MALGYGHHEPRGLEIVVLLGFHDYDLSYLYQQLFVLPAPEKSRLFQLHEVPALLLGPTATPASKEIG